MLPVASSYPVDAFNPLKDSDLTKFDSPGENQSFGSCCSDALVSAYENQLNQKGPQYAAKLSRMWNWFYARRSLGVELEASGATCYAVIEQLFDKGICLDSKWPYLKDNLFITPLNGSLEEGKKYKVSKVWTVKGIDQLLASLMNGLPVIFSTDVFGYNHAVAAVKVDSSKRVITVKDSNCDEANNYYKEISFDDFEKKSWDGWSFAISSFVPVSNRWLGYSWFRFLLKIRNVFF